MSGKTAAEILDSMTDHEVTLLRAISKGCDDRDIRDLAKDLGMTLPEYARALLGLHSKGLVSPRRN
jgi:cell wall assembly regulator SMI1